MLPNSSPTSLFCRRRARLRIAVASLLALCPQLTLPQAVLGQDTPSVVVDEEPQSGGASADKNPAFTTELLTGRVVWQAAALEAEFGISSVPEVSENTLALLSEDGRLIPLVENSRGRAFRKDERLRNTPLEILARVYEKQPFAQVLRIYEVVNGERFEVDYWCDVCAIVMYETGPCACCQDDNRLRKTAVTEDP